MTARTHVALAATLAALVGASEGMLADAGGLSRGALVVLGAAMLGTVGALFGVLQAASWWAVTAIGTRTGTIAWWRSATSIDPRAPREPIVSLHASIAAGALAVGFLAACSWVVLPRLFHIEDGEFARGFGLLLFSAAAIAITLFGVVAARLLVPGFARVDAVLGLPWPRMPVLRWLLWGGAPIALLLVPYLRRNADELAVFALPFWLVVFVFAEIIVAAGLRTALPSRGALWARLQWATLAGLAATLVGSVLLLRSSADAVAWTRGDGVVPVAADVLRRLGDLDRDGYSSWLGGGDCAPFDGSVNPGSRDLPDNGVDENCDGSDAVALAEENALAVFSGAFEKAENSRPNVVLVIVDAIRWDHTGLGGYEKQTTPYLDTLAEEALLFTRAYSQSSATMLSIPSILTGRDPSMMEWEQGKRLEPTDDEVTLARRLDDLGYHTAIIAVKYFSDFLQRIREPYEHDQIVRNKKGEDSDWYTGRAGPLVVESIRYIEAHAEDEDPFFLTLYIPEPHHTYDKHGFGLSDFGKKAKDLYDGEIANADRHIGFLIEYLKYRGLWDDTIFVVTSDHGEEFKEHGGKKHARTCYVESTHVPLVVHVPGVEHAKIDHPVGLMDIVPTILESVGATEEVGALEGQSLLVPVLAPELVAAERAIPCVILSQRARQGNFLRRALRTSKWLLVHEVLENDYELFDTEADPKEKKNVYEARRTDLEIERLRRVLNASLTGNLQSNLLTD